ncbi:MAG TPA: T9SS type A sorting domain-containing protein [Chitinophagales bacterium]|nr:T9SS type A sorting domain-containing protein [Chitinophagales bacterium]
MKLSTTTLLLILFISTAFATQEKKQTRIRLSGPGGYLDETSIYFDLGLNPAYVANQDGPKAFGQMEYSPAVYSFTSDNQMVSTNGFSRLTSSEVIALGVRTDTAGVHEFSASIITNFDSTTIIRLEDRQTGIFTDLRSTTYAVAFGDGEIVDNRFFLHISKAIEFASVTAGCSNNDGQLQGAQDNTVQWNSIQLYDSLGQLVNVANNVSGSFNFNGLAEGDYDMTFTYDGYITTKKLTVPGTYVRASIQPSGTTGYVNQEFVFVTSTHNATEFLWEMGDSALVGGVANPSYAYYEPGTYQVILTASNEAGCTYRDSVMVNVEAAAVTGINTVDKPGRNVWAYDNTITIQMNEPIAQGAELKIFNLLGQPVYYSQLTDATTEVKLGNEPTGYYIVSLQNNKVPFTKKVFIGQSK